MRPYAAPPLPSRSTFSGSDSTFPSELHLSDTTCRLFPLLGGSPIFNGPNNTAPTAAPLQYTATYKNLLLEFRNDTSISFFLTYRNSAGDRLVYRDQYAKFNYYPLYVDKHNDTLILSAYTAMEWVAPKVLVLNATMQSAKTGVLFHYAWVYEFDSATAYFALGGVSVKFSIIMNSAETSFESANHRVLTALPLSDVNFTWGEGLSYFGISVTFRIPFAPEQGPPMLCYTASNCNSSIASWVTTLIPRSSPYPSEVARPRPFF